MGQNRAGQLCQHIGNRRLFGVNNVSAQPRCDMESDTAAEPQPTHVEPNVTGINEGQVPHPHREGANAHSPISRSTTAVPLHNQQDDQQSGTAEEPLQQAASEAVFASEAALSSQSEAPLLGQPEQQGVEADTSGILASSHSVQEGNAAPDMQLGEQELQSQATQPAVEQAPGASAAAPATSHPDEQTALPSLPEQLPSSAVPPLQNEPSVSGQEAEAAPFAHATFVVPTENWKHLQIVPLATTAAEIKHSLCSNWNIAETALSVKYNRQELQDNQSLASCGIQVDFLTERLHPLVTSLKPLTSYHCSSFHAFVHAVIACTMQSEQNTTLHK